MILNGRVQRQCTLIRSSTFRRSFPSNKRSSSSDNCSNAFGMGGGAGNANADGGIGGGGGIVANINGLNGNGPTAAGRLTFDCAFSKFANGLATEMNENSIRKKNIMN